MTDLDALIDGCSREREVRKTLAQLRGSPRFRRGDRVAWEDWNCEVGPGCEINVGNGEGIVIEVDGCAVQVLPDDPATRAILWQEFGYDCDDPIEAQSMSFMFDAEDCGHEVSVDWCHLTRLWRPWDDE